MLACSLTVFVLKVVMLVVEHILFVEGLANLICIFLTLPVAITGTVSHFFIVDVLIK